MANGWFLGGGLAMLIAGIVLFGIGISSDIASGYVSAENRALSTAISYIGAALGIPGIILAIAGLVWPEEKHKEAK